MATQKIRIRLKAYDSKLLDQSAGEIVETPIGYVPAEGDLNVEGLDLAPEALRELLTVDEDAVRAELDQVREHLAKFGDDLPAEIREELGKLEQRLGV